MKTHGYAASSAPFVANGALLFVLHVLVRLLLPAAVVAYAKLYWGRRALAREYSEYPRVSTPSTPVSLRTSTSVCAKLHWGRRAFALPPRIAHAPSHLHVRRHCGTSA